MPATMEHERERWFRMSERQLLTRLNKITVPVKLSTFLEMCEERGNLHLWTAALERARTRGLVDMATYWQGRLRRYQNRIISGPARPEHVTMSMPPDHWNASRNILRQRPLPAAERTEAKLKVRVIRIRGRTSCR